MSDDNDFAAVCQRLAAFQTVELCKACCGGMPQPAKQLYDFAAFLRAAAPLFTQVFSADFLDTARCYRFATIMPDGKKQSINPVKHTCPEWHLGPGLTASEMINAIKTGDNFFISRSGKKIHVNLITFMAPGVCVIDVDHHDASARDQRQSFLDFIRQRSINCLAEPTSHGMHFFFPSDGQLTHYISGPTQATDKTGVPFDVEILACSYDDKRQAFVKPRACVLGCYRVDSYAAAVADLAAQTQRSPYYLPIPPMLRPTRDTSNDNTKIDIPASLMQPTPAAPATYAAPPTWTAYTTPQPAPSAPAATPTPAPTSPVTPAAIPPTAPPAADAAQPAPSAPAAVPAPTQSAPKGKAAVIPPADQWLPGCRNAMMYKWLSQVATCIKAGDYAYTILQCCAITQYEHIPDKTGFSISEVLTIVGSVSKQIGTSDADADRKLKKLCRQPKNAVRWALSELKATVSYNEMTQEVCCDLKDIYLLTIDIYNLCCRQLTMPEIERELRYVAEANRFHPVRSWLESLPKNHDAAELKKLFDVLKIGEKSIYQTMVTQWLRQCVCCLYNGTDGKFFPCEHVLVLQGAQRAGKTSLLRHLAIRQEWWHGGGKFDWDKDSAKRILTHWITELGEIGSTLRGDQDRIKAFISQEYDSYRLPYGHRDITGPRMTSLCGTTNSREFLSDDTGSMRFWVVPVPDRMDRKKILDIDAAALWAYIYTDVQAMVASGVSYSDVFRLTVAEADAAEDAAKSYHKKSQVETDLENLLYGGYVDESLLNWKTSTELANDLPWSSKPSANLVSRELKKMGVPMRIGRSRCVQFGVAVTASVADAIRLRSNGLTKYISVPDPD